MKNILIVDDDDLVRLSLSLELGAGVKDSRVLTARHGREAVGILGSLPVDLIVTDLNMPIMNGYDLVEYANKHHPRVPVFVMTGECLPDVRQRFRPEAVCRFVPKPFSNDLLVSDISSKLAAEERPHPAAV